MHTIKHSMYTRALPSMARNFPIPIKTVLKNFAMLWPAFFKHSLQLYAVHPQQVLSLGSVSDPFITFGSV